MKFKNITLLIVFCLLVSSPTNVLYADDAVTKILDKAQELAEKKKIKGKNLSEFITNNVITVDYEGEERSYKFNTDDTYEVYVEGKIVEQGIWSIKGLTKKSIKLTGHQDLYIQIYKNKDRISTLTNLKKKNDSQTNRKILKISSSSDFDKQLAQIKPEKEKALEEKTKEEKQKTLEQKKKELEERKQRLAEKRKALEKKKGKIEAGEEKKEINKQVFTWNCGKSEELKWINWQLDLKKKQLTSQWENKNKNKKEDQVARVISTGDGFVIVQDYNKSTSDWNSVSWEFNYKESGTVFTLYKNNKYYYGDCKSASTTVEKTKKKKPKKSTSEQFVALKNSKYITFDEFKSLFDGNIIEVKFLYPPFQNESLKNRVIFKVDMSKYKNPDLYTDFYYFTGFDWRIIEGYPVPIFVAPTPDGKVKKVYLCDRILKMVCEPGGMVLFFHQIGYDEYLTIVYTKQGEYVFTPTPKVLTGDIAHRDNRLTFRAQQDDRPYLSITTHLDNKIIDKIENDCKTGSVKCERIKW